MYTKAKAGERILTAIQLVGFGMVDSNAHRHLEFKWPKIGRFEYAGGNSTALEAVETPFSTL